MPAACEACRRLKAKCSRSGDEKGSSAADDPCERCKQQNRVCKPSSSRPAGRKPGSLGRYNGVDKALRKLQTELKKKRASPSPNSQEVRQVLGFGRDKDETLNHLALYEDTQKTLAETENCFSEASHKARWPPRSAPSESGVTSTGSATSRSRFDHVPNDENDERVSDPLGLLANAYKEAQALEQRTSTTRSSSTSTATVDNESSYQGLAHHLLNNSDNVPLKLRLHKQDLEHGLNTLLTREGQICRNPGYFKHSKVNQMRDTGPELDPVDLGLISMEEAESLFLTFFERLHPFNVILDPILHTPRFVRSHSALLFTWTLAISAQFDHKSSQVAKRLRFHGEHLSKHVYSNGLKSVEIAQGYYISLLSAAPASTMAEERSWLYTIYAFGVAAELGLDRPHQNSSLIGVGDKAGSSAQSSRGEASTTVSHNDNDSRYLVREQHRKDEDHIRRLARNRERTWLRILLWESAYSATRGRVSPFPDTELIRHIGTWYLHPLADPHDRYTCAFILLRQHLARLHTELRRQMHARHVSRHWVLELIDSTLQPWCESWLADVQDPLKHSGQISNIYLHHVYMHGRLWILSFALRGQVHEAQDTHAIKEDCFEAAIKCCESAVDDLQRIGEPLYCMLAPTWAMVSYAAVLALRLFPLLYGSQIGKNVELLGLLAQVALQLEQAGTTPSHRFGIAALLGQHLLMILQSHANSLKHENKNVTAQAISTRDVAHTNRHKGTPVQSETQPFDFSHPACDPFLEATFLPNDEDYWNGGFTGPLWDWFGQGCGGIV